MRKQALSTLALGALLLGAALGLSQTAHASGFEAARFGSEYGHATGPTPFALYYNPAALALTHKLHIASNLTLGVHSASYDRTRSSIAEPSDAQGANYGKASLRDALFAPAIAASYRINDFVIGVGMFIPFGGSQVWSGGGSSYAKYPGTKDGSARWHFIEGSTSTLYLSAGASYTFRPLRLSFGAAANFTYSTLNFTRALNGSFDDDITVEGRTHLDVAGASGSFGLGVLYEALKDRAWFGLSWQAPPGVYKDLTMNGTVRSLLAGTDPISSDVDLKQKMPDIIRFSARIKPAKNYELRLTGDFTRWSVFDRQCIVREGGKCDVRKDGSVPMDSAVLLNQQREWKNTFGIKAGGSYYFTPDYEAFASVAYDGNPIPLSTLDVSTIDGHDLSYTLGGRARFSDMLGVLVGLTYQHWLERDATGKSRLYQYGVPSRIPDGGGKYTQSVFLVNTMLELYFD